MSSCCLFLFFLPPIVECLKLLYPDVFWPTVLLKFTEYCFKAALVNLSFREAHFKSRDKIDKSENIFHFNQVKFTKEKAETDLCFGSFLCFWRKEKFFVNVSLYSEIRDSHTTWFIIHKKSQVVPFNNNLETLKTFKYFWLIHFLQPINSLQVI